jgi:hypothetical protein
MRTPLALAFFWLLLSTSLASCKTEAQNIVDAFKLKVDTDLQSRRIRKDVWPQTSNDYQEAGWYQERDEIPGSYSINVEKTESLVSPYLGTVEFPVTGSVSFPKNSKEEAANATEFKGSYSISHRLIYSYQNEQWVFKSEQCYERSIAVDGHVWGKCLLTEHGAHLPIMSTPTE